MLYQDLAKNLDQFLEKDAVSQELMLNPVCFPNSKSPKRLYEKDSVIALFRETDNKLQSRMILQNIQVIDRNSMQNNQQAQQILQELGAQVLGDVSIDEVINRGTTVMLTKILRGAGISADSIPNSLQQQTNLVLTTIYGLAMKVLNNSLKGLSQGVACCPITRCVLRENDMRSMRLAKNIFLIAARNSALKNPNEFYEANSKQPKKKTAELLELLNTLTAQDIVEAESALDLMMKNQNTSLSEHEKSDLNAWGVNKSDSVSISVDDNSSNNSNNKNNNSNSKGKGKEKAVNLSAVSEDDVSEADIAKQKELEAYYRLKKIDELFALELAQQQAEDKRRYEVARALSSNNPFNTIEEDEKVAREFQAAEEARVAAERVAAQNNVAPASSSDAAFAVQAQSAEAVLLLQYQMELQQRAEQEALDAILAAELSSQGGDLDPQ